MEVSFSEMLLVGIIAFLVLGPKEMIRLSRKVGAWVAKIRTEVNNFKILAEEQILKADDFNLKIKAPELGEQNKILASPEDLHG